MSGTNFLIGFDVAGFTLTWGPEIQEPLNHFLNFLQRLFGSNTTIKLMLLWGNKTNASYSAILLTSFFCCFRESAKHGLDAIE